METPLHLNRRIIAIGTDASIFSKGSALAKRMEHYGLSVDGIDVLVPGASGNGPIKLGNNVTAYPLSGNKFIAALKCIRLGVSLAEKDRTIVSVQDPFEVGLIGLVISRLRSVPLHVQIHIDFFSPYFRNESWRQRFQAVIAPFVLRRAASVKAVSEKIATYLRDSLEIDAKKITIAPIYVDASEIRSRPSTVDLHAKYPQFDWIVLVACRYVNQKNISLAIEAFRMFSRAHPKAGLVVAGSGPEEENLRSLVAGLGLNDSMIVGSWTGEFASCMRTSDVFLMSSNYEGWGMTIIEAAALGKPIIMTNVGCAGEFLINEKNGLVVPVRDSVAMAAALVRLYSNRAFGLNMGQEAKRSADTYMIREESDALMLQSWKSAL